MCRGGRAALAAGGRRRRAPARGPRAPRRRGHQEAKYYSQLSEVAHDGPYGPMTGCAHTCVQRLRGRRADCSDFWLQNMCSLGHGPAARRPRRPPAGAPGAWNIRITHALIIITVVIIV